MDSAQALDICGKHACGFSGGLPASDPKSAGYARVTQLATDLVQDGLALHFTSGMRLSGIADNLDIAVAIALLSCRRDMAIKHLSALKLFVTFHTLIS